jgi:hypothetical protein
MRRGQPGLGFMTSHISSVENSDVYCDYGRCAGQLDSLSYAEMKKLYPSEYYAYPLLRLC